VPSLPRFQLRVPRAQRRRVPGLGLNGLAFAGFLLAGCFKGDRRLAWMPVDLTLLLAAISALLAARSLLRSGCRLPAGEGWVCALFLLFAAPAIWSGGTPYAIDKVARLFTLTLFAMALPLMLFKTPDDLRRFFNALALLGLCLALDGLVTLLTQSGLHRLEPGSATTISLGRVAGIAAIWLTLLGADTHEGGVRWRTPGVAGRLRLSVSLVVLAALTVVLFATGARGPLLALLTTLVLAGLLFYAERAGDLVRFAACGTVILVFLAVGAQVAPDWSAGRIGAFLHADWTSSETSRADAFVLSLDQIAHSPMGIGWGAFAQHVYVPGDEPGTYMEFPHNLVLEVFLEGGWLAGIFFLGLLLAALHQAYRLSNDCRRVEARALFALLVFNTANALVSGEINNERLLFALIPLGLAFKKAVLGARCSALGGERARLCPAERRAPSAERRSEATCSEG
jgi:O-antigen ligase